MLFQISDKLSLCSSVAEAQALQWELKGLRKTRSQGETGQQRG